jgi:uncharacterized membrane protein YuzA (DUF378 family)
MSSLSATLNSFPVMSTAEILVIVGALNWLSIGLQNTNYVSKFVGENAKYVYILVGLAGLYLAYCKIMLFMKSRQPIVI